MKPAILAAGLTLLAPGDQAVWATKSLGDFEAKCAEIGGSSLAAACRCPDGTFLNPHSQACLEQPPAAKAVPMGSGNALERAFRDYYAASCGRRSRESDAFFVRNRVEKRLRETDWNQVPIGEIALNFTLSLWKPAQPLSSACLPALNLLADSNLARPDATIWPDYFDAKLRKISFGESTPAESAAVKFLLRSYCARLSGAHDGLVAGLVRMKDRLYPFHTGLSLDSPNSHVGWEALESAAMLFDERALDKVKSVVHSYLDRPRSLSNFAVVKRCLQSFRKAKDSILARRTADLLRRIGEDIGRQPYSK